ncbi:28S ribosomal protein S18c, mitochondrial isoform X2 [Amblyraja radiata]|uniref:28S ribosomal protein S18c, mitochondrial isoform X2 n=1 Tax=Amblyraja radiata TaxID=386614 RepID=UPI00140342E9|nr:28S ribosomal protein S18c, mitochondrial isoform X2 [Amblyraja radiata]
MRGLAAGSGRAAGMQRALRAWKPVYWQRGVSTQQIPSTSDMPIKLENPFKEPPKKCILCGVSVNYKNVQLLSQFISPYTGRIFGRHITGLCGKKQKEISKSIKKAQRMGFMSVMLKDPAFIKDPNICDYKIWE